MTNRSHKAKYNKLDLIFNSLAAPSRRKILDIVKNNPGIHVNKLTEHFDFSRYAVMKHLKILEEAELILSKRSSRYKTLYINAVPIQIIYDRWISKYSALWTKNLLELKYQLEEENKIMTQSDLKHMFVIYIKTTKEKLWDALTNPEMTSQYYYGSKIKSNLETGSTIEYILKDENGKETAPVSGVIKEIIPYQRLVHTFDFHDQSDSPSRVAFEIEESDMGLKLTVIHDQFEGETTTFKEVGEGWPYILSGLKTVLETGKSL